MRVPCNYSVKLGRDIQSRAFNCIDIFHYLLVHIHTLYKGFFSHRSHVYFYPKWLSIPDIFFMMKTMCLLLSCVVKLKTLIIRKRFHLDNCPPTIGRQVRSSGLRQLKQSDFWTFIASLIVFGFVYFRVAIENTFSEIKVCQKRCFFLWKRGSISLIFWNRYYTLCIVLLSCISGSSLLNSLFVRMHVILFFIEVCVHYHYCSSLIRSFNYDRTLR